MFRLIHISDIHLAPLPKPTLLELFSKRITGFINWQKNRAQTHRPEYLQAVIDSLVAQNPDHVVITGDLINLSLDAEIEIAGRWLETLAERLGGTDRLTVIAGNHDAYVPGSLNKALRRWREFISLEGAPAPQFPILREIGDISIISCNSAEATLPFQATGYFRKDQATRLANILEAEGQKNRFRIALIHHLPIENETENYKRLIGADLFTKCVSDAGCELVLHGHTHLQSQFEIAHDTGKAAVICVPATGQAPGGKKPAGGYNLFEIDGGPQDWTCTLKRFGISEHSTVEGTADIRPEVALLETSKLE